MTDLLVRVKAALVERYAIERELGQGGMAVVFLAQDLKHRRAVAIKVLRPELAMALGPERFEGEIVTVSDEPLFTEDRNSTRLNSSHVATSYAVFRLKKNTSFHTGRYF